MWTFSLKSDTAHPLFYRDRNGALQRFQVALKQFSEVEIVAHTNSAALAFPEEAGPVEIRAICKAARNQVGLLQEAGRLSPG